jgi:chitodextrinase
MEGTEGFTVNLTGASGASAGAPVSASITIGDLDTFDPSAPGGPQFSAVTGTTATATWAAATDNWGVVAYRYTLDSGANWTEVGNVLAANLTGLAYSTLYTMYVQARDAAGHWGVSSPAGQFTTTDGLITDSTTITAGSYSTGDIYQGTGQLFQGLWPSYSMGSASPTTTSNGKTYVAMVDPYQWLIDEDMLPYLVYTGPSWIVFGGFTSDPGASLLATVGTTSKAGAPNSYNAAYGTASWNMPSGVMFGFWEGYSTPITVIHR